MRFLLLAIPLILSACAHTVPTEARLFLVCETPIIFFWAESDGSLHDSQDIGTMREVLEQLDADDVAQINWCPRRREPEQESV